MKPTEKAYIAGLIDGEGCITITRRKKRKNPKFSYYQPLLNISNTDKRIIDYAQNLIHGMIIKRIPGKPGDRRRKKWKLVYHLILTGEKLKQTLKEILPYLRAKRKQAEIALEFPIYLGRGWKGRTGLEMQKQNALWRKIKKLNQETKLIYSQLEFDLEFVDKQLEFDLLEDEGEIK